MSPLAPILTFCVLLVLASVHAQVSTKSTLNPLVARNSSAFNSSLTGLAGKAGNASLSQRSVSFSGNNGSAAADSDDNEYDDEQSLSSRGSGSVSEQVKNVNDYSASRRIGDVSRPALDRVIPLAPGTVIPVWPGTSYLLVFPANTVPGQRNPWVIPVSAFSTGLSAVVQGNTSNASNHGLPLVGGSIIPVRSSTISILIQTDGSALETDQLHGTVPAMPAIVPFEVPSNQKQGQYGEELPQPAQQPGGLGLQYPGAGGLRLGGQASSAFSQPSH